MHHIADDAKFVKVAPSTLCAKWLLKCYLRRPSDEILGHLHTRAREKSPQKPQKKYLNVVDVVAIPGCIEKLVTKPKDQNILHHLFAQIMINTEDLFFAPIRFQGFLQLTGAFEIFAERLLNLAGAPERWSSAFTLHIHPFFSLGCLFSTYDNPRKTRFWIAIFLQMLRHGDKDAGRQRHVEDSVLLLPTLFKLF